MNKKIKFTWKKVNKKDHNIDEYYIDDIKIGEMKMTSFTTLEYKEEVGTEYTVKVLNEIIDKNKILQEMVDNSFLGFCLEDRKILSFLSLSLSLRGDESEVKNMTKDEIMVVTYSTVDDNQVTKRLFSKNNDFDHYAKLELERLNEDSGYRPYLQKFYYSKEEFLEKYNIYK